MTNDQAWCDELLAAAQLCGEPVWQLPMFAEYARADHAATWRTSRTSEKVAGEVPSRRRSSWNILSASGPGSTRIWPGHPLPRSRRPGSMPAGPVACCERLIQLLRNRVVDPRDKSASIDTPLLVYHRYAGGRRHGPRSLSAGTNDSVVRRVKDSRGKYAMYTLFLICALVGGTVFHPPVCAGDHWCRYG